MLVSNRRSWKVRRALVCGERNITIFLAQSRPWASLGIGLAALVIFGLAFRSVAIAQAAAYAALTVATAYAARARIFPVILGTLTPARFLTLFVIWGSAIAFSVVGLRALRESLHVAGPVVPRERLGLVLSLLLAPYVETYLANGVVQTLLRRVSWTASVLSGTLAFALPHGGFNVTILGYGLLFACLRARTKSLGLIVALHSFSNLAIVVFERP